MRGPGRPKKEKTEVLYMRLSEPVIKALREKALRERRPLSTTIEMILEAHLFTAVAQD